MQLLFLINWICWLFSHLKLFGLKTFQEKGVSKKIWWNPHVYVSHWLIISAIKYKLRPVKPSQSSLVTSAANRTPFTRSHFISSSPLHNSSCTAQLPVRATGWFGIGAGTSQFISTFSFFVFSLHKSQSFTFSHSLLTLCSRFFFSFCPSICWSRFFRHLGTETCLSHNLKLFPGIQAPQLLLILDHHLFIFLFVCALICFRVNHVKYIFCFEVKHLSMMGALKVKDLGLYFFTHCA